jgi:hypothetical protein
LAGRELAVVTLVRSRELPVLSSPNAIESRGASKPAPTALSAFITRLTGFERPASAPDQPLKTEPGPGVAVSVTTLPWGWIGPGGFTVTEPSPSGVTSSSKPLTKVAVTCLEAFMVSPIGVWDPLSAPLQPARTLPGSGRAVRLTTELAGCSRPPGDAAMLPPPVTFRSRL